MRDKTADMTPGRYRLIHGGFVNSRGLAAVSLAAEAWYWRVHAAADDFGNVDADPMLLYTKTVGRRLGQLSVEQGSSFVEEMVSARLFACYESNGEQYLHVVDFETLQPAPRNGKKIRRVPASPWDDKGNGPAIVDGADTAGDATGIQTHPNSSEGSRGNPDASSAPSASHSHTHSHTHTQSQIKNAALVSPDPAKPKPTSPNRKSQEPTNGNLSEKRDAVKAFDAWSEMPPIIGRGHPLLAERNEHRLIFDLIDQQAQEVTRIQRGGAWSDRIALVPLVVDQLQKKRVEFKNPKYPIGAVRSALDEWARNGDGAKSSNGHHRLRRLTAEERGEFAEPVTELPEL